MGFIRVRQTTTGHQFSVPEGVPLDGLTQVDRPAVDAHGVPLPPKYNVSPPKSRREATRPTEPTGEGDTTTEAEKAEKEK